MKSITLIIFILFSKQVFSISLHDFSVENIEGAKLNLATYKGRPVLVVNIATQCGFTYQLEDLEKLYKKYKGKKLEVLGVPSNDFGGQTPEAEKIVANFCQSKFGVSFPLTKKTTVLGPKKSDLFKFLTEEGGEINWNFEKFLLDSNGKLIKRWKSKVEPLNLEITKEIDLLIRGN